MTKTTSTTTVPAQTHPNRNSYSLIGFASFIVLLILWYPVWIMIWRYDTGPVIAIPYARPLYMLMELTSFILGIMGLRKAKKLNGLGRGLSVVTILGILVLVAAHSVINFLQSTIVAVSL